MAKKKFKEKVPASAQKIMDDLNKRYGPGTVMLIGDEPMSDVDVVSTGSLSLDRKLGIGGIPRGRITEIYGAEAAGKTSLALHIIAEAQRGGGRAGFIDAEHSLDVDYARRIGVKVEDLILVQPSCGEEAMDSLQKLLSTGEFDVMVIDSVAALVPQAELAGEIGDSHVGLQARLMSQTMRMLTGPIAKSNTTVIFINQLRMKIGVMFGNPETTPGGRALRFYTTVRLDLRAISKLKRDNEVYGSRVKVKIAKNKLAPPYGTCEFDLIHGQGINRLGEIVELADSLGIITKRGSWYSYKENNLGQGLDNTAQHLRENPELAKELEGRIKDVWSSEEA